MKKINSKGFVLAETLVVTVFLMLIFSMIYSYFYPLIGEYEKREVYDDVDGKYSVYWLKKMIEDPSYTIPSTDSRKAYFERYGFVRFKCSDITDESKKAQCTSLVKALQVEGCNEKGNNCSIFITRYTLKAKSTASATEKAKYIFKDVVNNQSTQLKKYLDNCLEGPTCSLAYFTNEANKKCCTKKNECDITPTSNNETCAELANKKIFSSGFQDYIKVLPDYNYSGMSSAKYRVIATFQHKADNNNYYSYATIEVNK